MRVRVCVSVCVCLLELVVVELSEDDVEEVVHSASQRRVTLDVPTEGVVQPEDETDHDDSEGNDLPPMSRERVTCAWHVGGLALRQVL